MKHDLPSTVRASAGRVTHTQWQTTQCLPTWVSSLWYSRASFWCVYTSNSLSLSDYDVVCVVDGHIGPLSVAESLHSPCPASEVLLPSVQTEGHVSPDITVFEKNYWEKLLQVSQLIFCTNLQDHTVRLLMCQYQQQEKKIKETFSVDVRLNLMKLKYDVYGYTSRHQERAKNDYRKGDKRTAKKSLLNCTMNLL